MYLNFFNLIEPPFSSLPDPRFFVPTIQHDEALATLLHGVQERKGLLILTGEDGVGKTTLCRVLLDRLDQSFKQSFIFRTPSTVQALLRHVHDDFELPTTGTVSQDRADVLNPFLVRNRLDGGDALIIVDDAHLLPAECLDAIASFFQPGTHPEQLAQILFVGHPSFAEKLSGESFPSFSEPQAAWYHLESLQQDDLGSYILHRMTVAGWKGDTPFTPEAIAKIHRLSEGNPARIHHLCQAALQCAAETEAIRISDDRVGIGPTRSDGDGFGLADTTEAISPPEAPPPIDQLGKHPLPPALRWTSQHLQQVLLAVAFGALVLGLGLGWALKSEEPVGLMPDPVVTELQERVFWIDGAGLIRTTQPARTADVAMLTLLNQWSPPNSVSADQLSDAMRVDIFPLELSVLERLDYPSLITWRSTEGAALTSAVLYSLNAETATILDPLTGVRRVTRDSLPALVGSQAQVLWEPLPGLFPPFDNTAGEQSEIAIRRLLRQAGFSKEDETDESVQNIADGIQSLQQFYGFEPTGVFSKEVHLVLSKEVHGERVPSLMLPLSLSSSTGKASLPDVPLPVE